MGYPGSVATFGTKNAGDTIQPADVNGLQTEVTAIENGLLGGFQHPITVAVGGITQAASTGSNNFAGPSSFAGTVSVTGNSTFAGDVAIGGGLSVSSNVSVTGTLTVSGALLGGRQPSAKVTHNTTQSMSSVFGGLSWNMTEYDSTGLHSTGSNSSRVNLTSSGLWLFGGQVVLAVGTPASTTTAGVRVLASDAACVSGNSAFIGTPGTAQFALPVTGVFYATDTVSYLTVQAMQTSGSGMNAVGSTGGGLGASHFWVQKVSV